MPLIVDAHQDLAYNAFSYGRDYRGSAHATRAAEAGQWPPTVNGNSLLGLEDYLRGQVAVIFGTLFAAPHHRRVAGDSPTMPFYSTPDEAHTACMRQLDYYYRLADEVEPFVVIGGQRDLEAVLASWATPNPADRRVGIVPLMEGADAIRQPQEAEEWMARGLRIVGLAWTRTRYAGGTGEPGPLTAEGRRLLSVMADLGLILDLSHATDESFLEAIDRFEGVVIASHSNPRACLNNPRRAERFLSDEMIRRLAERGGVAGIVPYNAFLRAEWKDGDRKELVTLSDVVRAIDHICQLTGSAAHVGFGSDFDGGFGVEGVPAEIDTIADLQKIGGALRERGYAETDIAAILGGNWLALLRRGLPA